MVHVDHLQLVGCSRPVDCRRDTSRHLKGETILFSHGSTATAVLLQPPSVRSQMGRARSQGTGQLSFCTDDCWSQDKASTKLAHVSTFLI